MVFWVFWAEMVFVSLEDCLCYVNLGLLFSFVSGTLLLFNFMSGWFILV